jgi:hypothetical protein
MSESQTRVEGNLATMAAGLQAAASLPELQETIGELTEVVQYFRDTYPNDPIFQSPGRLCDWPPSDESSGHGGGAAAATAITTTITATATATAAATTATAQLQLQQPPQPAPCGARASTKSDLTGLWIAYVAIPGLSAFTCLVGVHDWYFGTNLTRPTVHWLEENNTQWRKNVKRHTKFGRVKDCAKLMLQMVTVGWCTTPAASAKILDEHVFKPWCEGDGVNAKTFANFVNDFLFAKETTIPQITVAGGGQKGPDFTKAMLKAGREQVKAAKAQKRKALDDARARKKAAKGAASATSAHQQNAQEGAAAVLQPAPLPTPTPTPAHAQSLPALPDMVVLQAPTAAAEI